MPEISGTHFFIVGRLSRRDIREITRNFSFLFSLDLLLTLARSCGTRARARIACPSSASSYASQTHALTPLYRVSIGPLCTAQTQANVALVSGKLVKENGT